MCALAEGQQHVRYARSRYDASLPLLPPRPAHARLCVCSRRAATVARPFDGIPHIRGAGQADEPSDESTDRTLRGDGVVVPTTPPHMKKWRKNHEPGVQSTHPGVADDLDYKRGEEDPIYGRTEPVGVKVHDIMNVAPKSFLLDKANLKKEQIYLSQKREPLGKQYTRGHQLPPSLVEKGFGRATPQDVSGDLTKQLLMPVERLISEEERALYIKSHANYDPGEQRRRAAAARAAARAPKPRARACAAPLTAGPGPVTPAPTVSRRGYNWVDEKGPIDPRSYSFGGIVVERDVNGSPSPHP